MDFSSDFSGWVRPRLGINWSHPLDRVYVLATIRLHAARGSNGSWIQSLPGSKMSPLTISPNIHPTDQMSTVRKGERREGGKEGEREREGKVEKEQEE